MSLKVLTWNVGPDKSYTDMLQRAGKTPLEADEECYASRDHIAKFAFDFLIEGNNPDIMFLQETGSDLDRIKSWVGKDFEILSAGKDTAIAYRNSFEVIASSLPSITENRKFTILTLKDPKTEKIYNVASAHISGFDLLNPMKGSPNATDGDRELEELLSTLNELDADGTIIGLDANTTEELLSTLNELDADGTIIGLDANTTREHYPARLEILERDGFKTNDKDTAPTSFHKDLNGRVKSDYIYTRGFTFEPFEERLNLDLEDPITCPSDRIPAIEQLIFDPPSIEESEETPPVDLDDSFEGGKYVSVDEDKRDPTVRQRLKEIGLTMTPSPSPAGKGGTFRASSTAAEPFSFFSKSPLNPPSPDAAAAAEEEEPLPAFDTEGVEGLQAALDATVVAASLEELPDLLGDRDLEGEKSAAESAADADAKVAAAEEEAAAAAKVKEAAEKKAARIAAAEASLATISPAPAKPLPKAPSKPKPRAPISDAPSREIPPLPIKAGKAATTIRVGASSAVAAAMRARASGDSSEKAARERAEESAAAAAKAASTALASRKEKPKTDISCMRKTAIVAAGIFVAVVIPFVGSFYRVE